ncbi:MAG: hypothetical protein QOE64_241, partial [Frankiales bacterium]|nr:hypothetical protein [Frankiales bacterium]
KYSCDAVANTAVGPGAAALQGPVMPTGVQRLVGMKPVKVVNSATGLNTGVPAGKMTTREFDFTLAGAPTNATGAVLSASLNGPAAKSTVKLYGTNTPKTPMTAYAPAGISKTGTVLVNFASATRGKVHVSLTGGPVYLVVYQTGWLIRTDQADAAASSTGGRFVPAHVQLAKNATVSSQFPPNSPTYYSPDLGSGIEAVAIQLSTLNTRSNGSVVAYSTADGPVATAHTFTNKRTGTTLVISRVSSAVGKCTTSASETAAANRVCLKVNGLTGINAVIVGYWKKDVTEFPGRAVLFGSQRVLTGTSPTPGEIRVKIPDSVPSSATSVLLQVTGFNTAGPSIIRVYPDGSVAPIEFTVYTTKGDTTTNIGLTPLGANRYVRLKVYGSSAQLNVDVVGYVN